MKELSGKQKIRSSLMTNVGDFLREGHFPAISARFTSAKAVRGFSPLGGAVPMSAPLCFELGERFSNLIN